MAGLGIVIPRTGPGTGPVLPPPLHPAGITDYTHRWVASRIEGATGDPLAAWADTVTPSKALACSGAYILDEDGRRYARLDNVSGSGMTFPDAFASPTGIALVLKNTEISRLFLRTGGYAVSKQGNNQGRLAGEGTGGSGGLLVPASAAVTGLSVVQVALGPSPKFRWNATIGTLSGSAPVPGTPTANGMVWGSLAVGDLAVAEIVMRVGSAFTDAELDAIYAAMKEKYTEIP